MKRIRIEKVRFDESLAGSRSFRSTHGTSRSSEPRPSSAGKRNVKVRA